MRRLLLGVVGAAMLTIGVVAAEGATTTTYQGTFSGPVIYKHCSGAPEDVVASGTWSVAVHGQTDATVAFNIFTQEGAAKASHHVSYGGTVPLLGTDGLVFDILFYAGPNPVHVFLKGDSFSYVVGPPYIAFGLDCPKGVVTYSGTTS